MVLTDGVSTVPLDIVLCSAREEKVEEVLTDEEQIQMLANYFED